MGTISDKLTYLNTTKTKIREKINDLGEDLDENDTFRSYEEALENIYEDYPKITATDTQATLNNTKAGKMKVDLKGNTLQNGTPTPESPIAIQNVSGNNTIKVQNKNLFDISTIIRGKELASANGALINNSSWWASDFILIKSNTTYTSSNISANSKFWYDEDKNFISRSSTATATSPENAKFLRVNGTLASLDSNSELQIEQGSTATDYVTHEEQNISFPLVQGQKLMAGDYLADDGIHHVMGEKVFDGTENWIVGNRYTNTVDFRLNSSIGAIVVGENNTNGYVSHFTGNVNGASLDEECFWFNQEGYIRLRIKRTIASERAQFMAWLAEQYANGTPVTAQYELATEVIDTYTEEQQTAWEEIKALRSYNEQANVSQTNNDLPFILDIKALRGE